MYESLRKRKNEIDDANKEIAKKNEIEVENHEKAIQIKNEMTPFDEESEEIIGDLKKDIAEISDKRSQEIRENYTNQREIIHEFAENLQSRIEGYDHIIDKFKSVEGYQSALESALDKTTSRKLLLDRLLTETEISEEGFKNDYEYTREALSRN